MAEKEAKKVKAIHMNVEARKVKEVKQKLLSFINKRVFVSNWLRNADVEVEHVENFDGTKPHVVIRIKNMKRRWRNCHAKKEKDGARIKEVKRNGKT